MSREELVEIFFEAKKKYYTACRLTEGTGARGQSYINEAYEEYVAAFEALPEDLREEYHFFSAPPDRPYKQYDVFSIRRHRWGFY